MSEWREALEAEAIAWNRRAHERPPGEVGYPIVTPIDGYLAGYLSSQDQVARLREALEVSKGIEPLVAELYDCLPGERSGLEKQLRAIRKQVRRALTDPPPPPTKRQET